MPEIFKNLRTIFFYPFFLANIAPMSIILAIESSCDDTSASVSKDGKIFSNIIASQRIHEEWGGVVPELASRDHLKNILPTVDLALKTANVKKNELTAIAFTRGPGLIGSLHVGVSFAKGLALSLDLPLIAVNHMHAHILANFIDKKPVFPFLNLTVSGGHTQLVLMHDFLSFEIIGETIDDAAGEAFDKCAKILGLPYPGGPLIDKYAKDGNPKRFVFPKPKTANELDFSFSGLKTAVLYFLQKEIIANPDFVAENLHDLCASIQYTIVEYLLQKTKKAAKKYHVPCIALSGGVSANSLLREKFQLLAKNNRWDFAIPDFQYCTDNAAMIAITAHHLFHAGIFVSQDIEPAARWDLSKALKI